MEINRVFKVYFSATYTTLKIVDVIANELSQSIINYDITSVPIIESINMVRGDVLVIGMPVYGGRIPKSALQSIAKLNGNGVPAIIVCVYGNRDYDDALLELRNEIENRGFKVVSASAFVARHSIFTQIAKNRPNTEDITDVKHFAISSLEIINSINDFNSLTQISLKGNMPYKEFKQLPIYPSANEFCVKCGVCALKCPANAILLDTPWDTDKNKCIACGRCIIECNVKARDFRGEFFDTRATKFNESFSLPRANETYFAKKM